MWPIHSLYIALDRARVERGTLVLSLSSSVQIWKPFFYYYISSLICGRGNFRVTAEGERERERERSLFCEFSFFAPSSCACVRARTV